MQLQNEIVKKHTPIKSLLIDWLIIFGTYLFIRIFFALFGLHQNIVLLGCCLAILPYLFGALYLQKSHKQCQLWLAALAILIPSVVEKAAIYLFGAYLYNLRPINVVGVAFEVHHKPDKDSPHNTDKQIHRGKARKRGCKGSGKAVCKGKHLAGKVSPRRKAYRLSDFVKEIDKEQIGGI